MPLVRLSSASRLDARMCLCCGHRGDEFQSPSPELLRCPECGEDLYSRPPRSYAELEGLADPMVPREAQPPGLVRRWIRRWAGWWRVRGSA